MASPQEHPVNCEKLQMHVSRVTTVRWPIVRHGLRSRNEQDASVGEDIGTLEIQFSTVLHKLLAVVYSIFEMRVQDFHSYIYVVIGWRMLGTSMENPPTICDQNAPFGVRFVS